jgi:cold shock CspA family protein
VYANLPDPPLTQDGKSLESFVDCFDRVSTTTAPQDQKLLVAMFITGLDGREVQNVIVSALEKRGMTKIRENKQVEIHCVWDDVKKELKRCSLLAGKERVLRKRRKVE